MVTDRQSRQTDRKTDRQTDRKTDRQTDRQTDKVSYRGASLLKISELILIDPKLKIGI